MLQLRVSSSRDWLDTVLADFDAFLLDHAACERKASATALSFVVRYPDRTALLGPLIEMAREELEHFEQVYRLIEARRLQFPPDTRDPYVGALLQWIRGDSEERLLDRLLASAVIEARGCERFGLIAESLQDEALRGFYADITQSEARHHGLFQRLAREYFPADVVDSRIEEFLDYEAEVIHGLALRPALH